jgi:large subunit ribosomal protein L21
MSNIAVINLAGAQYLVKPGDKFEVNRLQNEVDEAFSPEILLSTDGESVLFNGGKIETRVIEQKKGEKLYILKFKAKSRYRRRTGHRQLLSVIEVVSINGQKAEKSAKAVKAPEVSTEKTVTESKPKKAKATTKVVKAEAPKTVKVAKEAKPKKVTKKEAK